MCNEVAVWLEQAPKEHKRKGRKLIGKRGTLVSRAGEGLAGLKKEEPGGWFLV